MDETRGLTDDRIGPANEGRQTEFRDKPTIAVEELTARHRAEEGVMGWKSRLDLLEEFGPLREFDTMIAIDQPIGFGAGCPNHFLQAENIRVDIDQIPHQRLMQPATPCIQRNDA